MKNNILYKKHKVCKTRGKKHKLCNNRTRNSLTRRIRKTQVGGIWGFKGFKTRNTTSNASSLGRPPVALPQVYDSRYIDEQQRLLDMFEHENHIRQMFNVDLQEEKRQLDNFARQKQQRQETRLNSRSQQEEIDRADKEWLANQQATQEKEVAQRRFREKEKGKNQYTSHGISGVGWMGWDQNDEANLQRHKIRVRQRNFPTLNWFGQGTSTDGVSAVDWNNNGPHWH
jgi:hypothetical protein